MNVRRVWTTDELREMSQLLAKPPYPQFLVDNLRAALIYAADLMDAADAVINAQRGSDAPPPTSIEQGERT